MTRARLDGTGWAASGLVRAGRIEDRVIPSTDPVDRDPCWRCGVRTDVGCTHSRSGGQ